MSGLRDTPRQEFYDDIECRRTRRTPGHGGAVRKSLPGWKAQGVKLPLYKHLLDINAGFDQIIRALAAIRKHPTFVARELDELSEFAKEARAATNSYLIGVMESAETEEAGRRFGKRREREQREK